MNDPKWYSKFEAYKISKLANILFSKALLKRISPLKKILVHSLHPGRVATGIASKQGRGAGLAQELLRPHRPPFHDGQGGWRAHDALRRDAPRGAARAHPYWHPIAKRRDLSGKPADDAALAEKLWAWSEAQVARITGKPSES